MEDRGQGRLRVYVHLVDSTVTGWPASTDGLDGDLARLQQWPRREDGPVRARGGLRRSTGAVSCLGSVPRRPPPCAAAVRRAAADWCGGFPTGTFHAHLLLCVNSPRCVACTVTGRQARGALRAPLKGCKESSHPIVGRMRGKDAEPGPRRNQEDMGKLNQCVKSSPAQSPGTTSCIDTTGFRRQDANCTHFYGYAVPQPVPRPMTATISGRTRSVATTVDAIFGGTWRGILVLSGREADARLDSQAVAEPVT